MNSSVGILSTRWGQSGRGVFRAPSRLWLLPVLGLLLTAPAQAGDYGFIFTNSTAIITNYSGPGGAINVPATVRETFFPFLQYSVSAIGVDAFLNCTSLTSVTISNGVRSIGGYAFQYCSALTNVMIPASITNLGTMAFDGCNSLLAINVDASNPSYSRTNGILFNKSQSLLIQ